MPAMVRAASGIAAGVGTYLVGDPGFNFLVILLFRLSKLMIHLEILLSEKILWLFSLLTQILL